MKKIHVLIPVLCCFCLNAFTQETEYRTIGDSAVIKAVSGARHYVSEILGLKTGDDFYAWQTDSLTGYIKARAVKNMYAYVYAWDPRSKKSPFDGAFRYFGSDHATAKQFEDSLKQMGYETMLYKTAGTSAAQITTRMLEYNLYSLQYIILHEAVHRHRQQSGSKLPYIFEEALCDLVAAKHLPVRMGWKTGVPDDSLGRFHVINYRLHEALNKAVNGKINTGACDKLVKNLLLEGDLFQKDRFGYTVNHAYLERYTSYCKYYFLLEKVYERTGNWKVFKELVFSLEGSEKKVAARLKKLAR